MRIDNIEMEEGGESADSCLQKVKKAFTDLGVKIPDNVIDRAHRIGKPTESKRWGKIHPVIVRFTTWWHRTAVYHARKSNGNPNGKYGVRLDLTSRRFKLLRDVQGLIEKAHTQNKSQHFAFSDINCALSIRLKSGQFKYFKTLDEAKVIIRCD